MCDMAISQHSPSKQMLLELRMPERHRSAEVELKSIGYRVTPFHEHGSFWQQLPVIARLTPRQMIERSKEHISKGTHSQRRLQSAWRAAWAFAALPSCATSVVEQKACAAWSRRQRGAISTLARSSSAPAASCTRAGKRVSPAPAATAITNRRNATDRTATSGNHPRLRRLRLCLGRLRRLRRRPPDAPPTPRRHSPRTRRSRRRCRHVNTHLV